MAKVPFLTALVLASALALGCGDDGGSEPGTLVVREAWAKGPLFVEGHVSFVSVFDDGARVASRRVGRAGQPRLLLRRQLAPGRYRVASHVRSCAGNCGHLDPPSDRCSAEVAIEAGERVVVTFRRAHERPACRVDTG